MELVGHWQQTCELAGKDGAIQACVAPQYCANVAYTMCNGEPHGCLGAIRRPSGGALIYVLIISKSFSMCDKTHDSCAFHLA